MPVVSANGVLDALERMVKREILVVVISQCESGLSLAGKIHMPFWTYRTELVIATDTRRIAGRLSTIYSGTDAARHW